MKFLKSYLPIMITVIILIGSVGYIFYTAPGIEDALSSKLADIDAVPTSIDALAKTASRDNAQLLSRAVNGEARGEPYIGQVAVGSVILNRVKHPSFPKSISGVIYQPGAFTAVSDGQINVPISTTSTVFKACKDAINGWDPSEGAIYYYNPAKTTNKWIWSRPVVKTIGKHKFAK